MSATLPLLHDTIAPEPLIPDGRIYPTRGRALNQVLDVMESLGTTPSELRRLLDTPTREMIFQWTSGRKRPSSKYLTRMLHLILLKEQGKFDLAEFKKTAKEYWLKVA